MSALIAATIVIALIGFLIWLMKDLSAETASTISFVSGICGILSSCN